MRLGWEDGEGNADETCGKRRDESEEEGQSSFLFFLYLPTFLKSENPKTEAK